MAAGRRSMDGYARRLRRSPRAPMSSSPKARSHPTAPAGLELLAHEVAHAVDEVDDVYLLSVSWSDCREHGCASTAADQASRRCAGTTACS